jgi:hypothetical protein
MPDLIRHPEGIEFAELWPSPQWRFIKVIDFLQNHQYSMTNTDLCLPYL